jgi:hypothetical protein
MYLDVKVKQVVGTPPGGYREFGFQIRRLRDHLRAALEASGFARVDSHFSFHSLPIDRAS